VARAEALLLPILSAQDGAVTTAQALAAGVTKRELRTLVSHGWKNPSRGVLIEAEPVDEFRAGLRAALLACDGAAACCKTSARLHDLWGLPVWTAAELPELILPRGMMRAQRPGFRLHFGMEPQECIRRKGFPAMNLARTVAQLVNVLPLDEFVCLLDSALRAGWIDEGLVLTHSQTTQLRKALVLADALSESPLETLLRLLLVRAGLAPEVLQLRLFTRDGECYARLDLAWPSRRLAVEADGAEHHDQPKALYGDRRRQNLVLLAGWTVLRFTWHDVLYRPAWVVAQVREALSRPAI
jgi:hypothetical protein